MDKEILMSRLQEIALERNQTLTNIFLNSGVGKNFKSNLNYANPSLGKITMLANYLNVSVDYLLGKTDKKEKHQEKKTTDEDIKVALFGGDEEVTDEMWEEVKNFVAFVKGKNKK